MTEKTIERKLTERQRFWLDHLNAWEKSRGSMKAYAAVHGLELRSFYHWKSWLTRKGLFYQRVQTPIFQKLKIERSITSCRLHLPNGARVEWNVPLTMDDLTLLVQTMGKLP